METIKYKGYEWLVINEDEQKVTLLMEDVLKAPEVNFDEVEEVLQNFAQMIDIDKVRLLSIHEAVDLTKEELTCGNNYWLADKYLNTEYVWDVSSSGYVGSGYADYDGGVRPVIEINKNELIPNDVKEELNTLKSKVDRMTNKVNNLKQRINELESVVDKYEN